MMQVVNPGRPTGNMMQRVFDVLTNQGACTIEEIERILDFDPESIRRALRRLGAMIEKRRAGKRLRYALKDGASRPADLRGAHTTNAHKLRKAGA